MKLWYVWSNVKTGKYVMKFPALRRYRQDLKVFIHLL